MKFDWENPHLLGFLGAAIGLSVCVAIIWYQISSSFSAQKSCENKCGIFRNVILHDQCYCARVNMWVKPELLDEK